GHQPMPSPSGRYVLVFNGEIYNFRTLRRRLEGLGYRFRGGSDTEVLVAAIEAWGLEAALERLNGMFAFAVWDRRERALHLARDRMGEKPLYYGWVDRTFLFASELKSLRAHPGFRPEVDREALALFLRLKYVPTPWSIYRAIRKLEPGHWVTVRPDRPGSQEGPIAYWDAREVAARARSAPFPGTLQEAAERLEELLADAVSCRLESDAPLGALLSGGIDSSTVVALMRAQGSREVRTFTVGFRETAFDESAGARAVARHLGTDHTEIRVEPEDALAVIPRLPSIYDEPFADSSQIPTLLVSELARRWVTVALSGDGGDELFGGYNRYSWVPALNGSATRAPGLARRAGAAVLERLTPARWERILRAANPVMPASLRQRIPADKLHKLVDVLRSRGPDDAYVRLISHWPDPSALVVGGREPPAVATDPARWPAADGVAQRMMLVDALTYLPDDILAKVDRASMSVSLEVRVPFLDHRVVEFAWSLPASLKVRDGRGKLPLRAVLSRHVPAALVERPKMGFGVPIGDWLRGPLRGWAQDLLDPERIRSEGFLRPEPIAAAWEEHLSGRRNRQYQLWDVLMLQAWLETWGTGAAVRPEATAVR
ncbi:MAG TPA: asparagine synthase (glutamine-hydrolyzing), partial [Actinomycetota bacterium]|nr:asparagine synthase (glutamine-hydrolyzing) [Actinomycetota bacterium]